jgi:hypothetical protein
MLYRLRIEQVRLQLPPCRRPEAFVSGALPQVGCLPGGPPRRNLCRPMQFQPPSCRRPESLDLLASPYTGCSTSLGGSCLVASSTNSDRSNTLRVGDLRHSLRAHPHNWGPCFPAHASTARPLRANRPCGRFWMTAMITTRTRILVSTAPMCGSINFENTPRPSAA